MWAVVFHTLEHLDEESDVFFGWFADEFEALVDIFSADAGGEEFVFHAFEYFFGFHALEAGGTHEVVGV